MKENRRGVDPEERAGGEGVEGMEGEKIVVKI